MSEVTRCIKASDYFTIRVIVLSVPYKRQIGLATSLFRS